MVKTVELWTFNENVVQLVKRNRSYVWRLPETGPSVLSSGSQFLPVPVIILPLPAAGKR